MKLTIARADLLTALSTVKPAAKGSTLPVLSHVAINTFEKSVEFLCSNLDLTLRSKCEADVSKKGCTTVRCSLLHALVSSFTADEVELELVKDLVHVRCGTSKYQLATLPFEEFPVATKLKDALEFSLPQHTLRGLLHATSFCQSTDESRYILCGSLVSLNGTLTLVSTDGRRLARMNYKSDDLGKLEREFILPRFAVNELNRLLSTDEAAAELVRIQATENAAEFKLGDTLIITKLIEGNYPNYKQVIPSTREIHPVTLSRTELLDCLKRVAFIANCGVGSCKLEFRKQTLTLSAESNKDNVGVAHEQMLTSPAPKVLRIAFNVNYLIDALNVLDDEEILFYGTESNAPAVLRTPKTSQHNRGWKYVVMPFRLEDDAPKVPAAEPEATAEPVAA